MNRGFRPRPPEMRPSTRAAIAVLIFMVGALLIVRLLPYPAGWVLFVAIVYAGIPLAIMVVNDLIQLRQIRMLARRIEVFPPSTTEPHGRIKIDREPLALEHLAKWRSWSQWFLRLLVAAIILWLVPAPLSRMLGSLALLIALPPEIIRGMTLIQWIVPSVWMRLSRIEQARLRIFYLGSALVTGAIWLTVASLVVYLFGFSGEPWAWNHFAFALLYGTMSWPCGRASLRLLKQSLRKVPPDDPESMRFM